MPASLGAVSAMLTQQTCQQRWMQAPVVAVDATLLVAALAARAALLASHHGRHAYHCCRCRHAHGVARESVMHQSFSHDILHLSAMDPSREPMAFASSC